MALYKCLSCVYWVPRRIKMSHIHVSTVLHGKFLFLIVVIAERIIKPLCYYLWELNWVTFCNFKISRYDIHSRSYKNSIKFLGDNDDEFTSTSTNKPIVEIDGCKVQTMYMVDYYNEHYSTISTIVLFFMYLWYFNFRCVKESQKPSFHWKQKNEVNSP